MSPSAALAHPGPSTSSRVLTLAVVESDFGPIGVIESPKGLAAIRLGMSDVLDLPFHCEIDEVGGSEIADLIRAYASGKRVSLDQIPLDLETEFAGTWTPFRDCVTKACRAVPYGAVATYAQLADRVGAPRASRAVGGVMARNPFPLVVPCHRVLRTGGGMGGFSAPTGITLKQQLLDMERKAASRSR